MQAALAAARARPWAAGAALAVVAAAAAAAVAAWSGCWSPRRAFKAAVHSLPSEVRAALAALAFWPTVAWNRFYCAMWPSRRQLFNRVHRAVLLGAVPLSGGELVALRDGEGVRGIVNMCREWDRHRRVAAGLGLRYQHLPTIDYDVPTLEDCLAGAEFVHEHACRCVTPAAGPSALCGASPRPGLERHRCAAACD